MMKKMAPPKKDIKIPKDPTPRRPAPPKLLRPRPIRNAPPRGGINKPMPMPERGRPMPIRDAGPARGGISRPMPVGGPKNVRSMAARPARGGISRTMKSGGNVKKYSGGGSIYRKAADGVAHKGKTHVKMVKMAEGGKC